MAFGHVIFLIDFHRALWTVVLDFLGYFNSIYMFEIMNYFNSSIYYYPVKYVALLIKCVFS